MNFKPEEITFLKDFILKESGVIISTEKEYLLSSRLGPVVRKLKLEDFSDLVMKLKMRNQDALTKTIDALTTHETYFYRDIKPFTFFEKNVLPKIIENKKNSINKTINIWCIACSTGQEPYSLNMILNENKVKLGDLDWKILGTDISADVVEKAKKGIYSQFEVQRGLPATMLIKYFEKKSEISWGVKDILKDKVSFSTNNILELGSITGNFDCIFCRNVLIYFEKENKIAALKNLHKNMAPGCNLFLGTSETTNLIPDLLNQSEEIRSVYIKK